jgi:hypothetical protein
VKIAIIAWGSLCWDPRDLSIISENWFKDGPELPVEFARISSDGRLTLVVKPNWDKVKTLYAVSSFDNLKDAIENLRVREGTTDTNIGYYNFLTSEHRMGRAENEMTENLFRWKTTHDAEAVIWTDLSPNFSLKRNVAFNLTNIGEYFKELPPEGLRIAREYVVRTPGQINTRFRTEIEQIIVGIEQTAG